MSTASKKIGEIQGLRALAALLVLFFHANFISGGFIGVDIFYVISGFLITGLLVKELNLNGRISLRAFYLRRSKRLLPASFLVLLVTAVLAWWFLPAISRGSIGRDLVASSLYISNYLFAFWQNDYQNLNSTPSPFIHYWSLAVEEQFYLFWPLLILGMARFRSHKKFYFGFSIVVITSLALGIWLTKVAPIWAFYSLPTRAWELGFGAFLSICIEKFRRYFPDWVYRQIAILGLILLVLSIFYFDEHTPFPGSAALVPVTGTTLLILSIGQWPRVMEFLATNRISLWLGKISYPLYLWHWPILVLPISFWARELTLNERFIALFVTLLLADLTNRYIERPIQLRKYSAKRIIASISLGMITAITFGLLLFATTTSAIIINGKLVTLESIESRPAPYENGCHLNYHESISPECTFGDLTSNKTVVLYGDSHAVQWFPALEMLANKKGFRLITLTKSACPSIAVIRESVGAFQMSNCLAWREGAIKRIQELKPDLIILASFEHFLPPGDPKLVESWWQNGGRETFAKLKPLSKQLIYLIDTPLPSRNIPNCLASMSADRCIALADNGLPQFKDFEVIDPKPWLCAEICPGIVRGRVAYRDASHISVATSLELASRLWSALLEHGFSL